MLFRPRITSLCHDVCDTLMSWFSALALCLPGARSGLPCHVPTCCCSGRVRRLNLGHPLARDEDAVGNDGHGNRTKTGFISGEIPFLPGDRDTTVPVTQCNGLCHVTGRLARAGSGSHSWVELWRSRTCEGSSGGRKKGVV